MDKIEEEVETLSEHDFKILIFLVRNRLHYEARRKPKINDQGSDYIAQKVWELSELAEKLERIKLAN